jgi:hypothetical protein
MDRCEVTGMHSDEPKQIIENFDHADPETFASLITDDFRFEIVCSMEEFPPSAVAASSRSKKRKC